MTRNSMPMPPVRIVPASRDQRADQPEAGERFRRMLDAQRRCAAANAAPTQPPRESAPGASLLAEGTAEDAASAPETAARWDEQHAGYRAEGQTRERPERLTERLTERPTEQLTEQLTEQRPAPLPEQGNASRHGARATPWDEAPESAPAAGATPVRDTSPAPPSTPPATLATALPWAGTSDVLRATINAMARTGSQARAPGHDSDPRLRGGAPRDGAGGRGTSTFPAPAVSRVAAPPTPLAASFVAQFERDVVELCAWQDGAAGTLPGALPDTGTRTVTLVPDPDVLPDTQLSMTISPDALRLRFHCKSAQSRQLLSLHGDTLKDRLARRTARTIDLEVIAA